MEQIAILTLPERGAIGEARERPRARVLRHLKERIARGDLPPGQVLPSALELAQTLQVNRQTVNSALEMLSDEGVINSNGGRLRIVAAARPGRSRVLMEHTVAIITPSLYKKGDDRDMGGSSYLVSHGALHALESADCHAFALHPKRLNDGFVQHLTQGKPYGVIVSDVEFGQEEQLRWARALAQSGVPVVAYGGAPYLQEFDQVSSDHEAGAYSLTRWLLDQGRRRILMTWIEPANQYWFAPRRAGYERAMREAGLGPLPVRTTPPIGRLATQEQFEAAARQMAGYLTEHLSGATAADAVMAASDEAIPLLATACRLFGKVPNEDVALVGYDHFWPELKARAWDATAPQATVDKLAYHIGEELVQLLLDRVQGRLPDEPQCRIVPPQVVVL